MNLIEKLKIGSEIENGKSIIKINENKLGILTKEIQRLNIIVNENKILISKLNNMLEKFNEENQSKFLF